MQLSIEGTGDNLVLLYLGYAQDPRPFYYIREHLPENSAVAFIWEHDGNMIALNALSKFKKVRLIAWSMGVMLAPIVLDKLNLNYEKRYALNGSLEGIDELYGIAPKVWDDNLRNLLTIDHVRQFYKLMCLDKKIFKEYSEHCPLRELSQLQKELQSLKEIAEHKVEDSVACNNQFFYDQAFIGKRDLIFPPEAIQRSFARAGVETVITNGAHYDPALFIELVAKSFD